MAPGASPVSTSTSRRSAVSCELRQTSSACCSGESSSPKAAWMPPCAFAELHDCSEPLVAKATRAPARCAETAAARPEAPLPTTSTSKDTGPAMRVRAYHRFVNSTHYELLWIVQAVATWSRFTEHGTKRRNRHARDRARRLCAPVRDAVV